MPLSTYFFLGLDWPWVAEFVGFIIIFICFLTQHNLVNRNTLVSALGILPRELLLLFTLTHRYNAVRGHKQCSSPRKMRKTIKSKYRVGKHDAFHFPPYCTRDEEGAQKINQFANWTNIVAGIHSTTASEFRLFPQLTNSYLLTTDHQYSGYHIVAVWSTASTVQKARYNSGGHKIGTHLLSGVLSE